MTCSCCGKEVNVMGRSIDGGLHPGKACKTTLTRFYVRVICRNGSTRFYGDYATREQASESVARLNKCRPELVRMVDSYVMPRS